jgi:hypothetical protein
MVKWRYKYLLLSLILFVSISIQAQRHLITDVQLSKNTVYVGEPVEVRVSIFTSTWFTSGVNPGNIKVNDAFTVYFRSLSTSKKIKGQTYAGVILYFNVFPYDDNDIVFPSLEFTVETPDVGGYKGVKRVVKTPERTIKVKGVPPGFNKSEWLVTSNVSVSDNWLGDKNNVKVGDVLERRVTRNVSGTVSELVPPILWDSIANVGLYPTRSDVKNNKTKTSISATRVDGMRYLFEKEGDVIIPEKELTWWNPRAKKLYKRTLKGYTIQVLPNPDLGMLETMRDSLNIAAVNAKDEVAEAKKPTTILGLSIKQFAALLVINMVVLYILIKVIKRVYNKLKLKQETYKVSEAFYFKQFMKATNGSNSTKIINTLYSWIDKLDLEQPTITYFISTYGDSTLKQEYASILKAKQNTPSSTLKLDIKKWKMARSNFLAQQKNNFKTITRDWVNP